MNGIEELIKTDCDKITRLLTEIREMHDLTTNEETFKRAKTLWKESIDITNRIKKLDYKEEHILPIVRKKMIHLLEKAHEEAKEL